MKFLPSSMMAGEAEQTRFVHEAQAAAELNHLSIATVYTIEEVDSEMFIVMEFIEGQELRKLSIGNYQLIIAN